MNLEVRFTCIENQRYFALQRTLRVKLAAVWALNKPM